MRKLFLSMAAVAALLTSCSKDETTTAPVIERSKVTFTVNAPELSTRAEAEYGTGLTAKTLDYVIYDLAEEAGKNQITGTTTFPDGELETEVTVDLVEGREYEAIFFAHAEDAPYTFNKTEQTMTINTTSLAANAEEYDAFYKYVEPFEIEAENFSVDVEMKRPFAQLNVATNDASNPAGAMIDAATTGVEVEAYNTLNFKDGTVSGKETIIYALADKMDGTITANNVDYSWLTMNYILVNTQETVGVKFLFTDTDKDNNVQTYERKYSAVPVERNHKTNIIGSILTSPTEFKVEILPGFEDPTYIRDVDNTEEVTATVTSLQDAINQAIKDRQEAEKENPNLPPTTVIFKLTEDGNVSMRENNSLTTRASYTVCESSSAGAIVIDQIKGLNFVIDGNGITYDGTFDIHGNAAHTGEETLTFTNINFKHDDGAIDFISCNTKDSHKRYAHNVTIENCTFTGNANGTVVGARFRQAYNLHFVNCVSGSGMHSFAQLTSINDGLVFDNVTIENASEGGINLMTSAKNVTIKNSNIKAADYGVRADGENANDLVIENSSIEAKVPVLVRYATGAYNVELKGNTLTSTNLYDVVFTNVKDDQPYAVPTGNWSITGAEGLNVYPTALTEGYNASSSEQLSQAIAAGATTVNLAAGTYKVGSNIAGVKIVGTEDDVVIDMKNQTPGFNGGNVDIENVKLEFANADYKGFQHTGNESYKDCTIVGQPFLYGNNVVFDNCTFEQTSANSYNVWTYGAKNVEFNSCTFNSAGKSVLIYHESAGQNVKFNNCTLNASAPVEGKAAIEIDSSLLKDSHIYDITITNTKANGFANGSVSGNSLWNNKKGNKTNITIDGVKVLSAE